MPTSDTASTAATATQAGCQRAGPSHATRVSTQAGRHPAGRTPSARARERLRPCPQVGVRTVPERADETNPSPVLGGGQEALLELSSLGRRAGPFQVLLDELVLDHAERLEGVGIG